MNLDRQCPTCGRDLRVFISAQGTKLLPCWGCTNAKLKESEMTPADLLPFASRQVQHLQRVFHSRAISTVRVRERIYGPSPDGRKAEIAKCVRRLWWSHVMAGFLTHHYPVGTTIDLAGWPCLILRSAVGLIPGRPRGDSVRAIEIVVAGQGPDGAITRVTLGHHAALNRVWQKFGLEPSYV